MKAIRLLKDLLHAINILGDDRDVTKNDSHSTTYVGDDDEDNDEEAWDLLTSLAGYCADSEYNKWFEGKDAEII